MSLDYSHQVGRKDAKFSPMPFSTPIDKYYDVKVSKKTPTITFEKTSGRPIEKKVSKEEAGSTLDYNPKYQVAKHAPVAHSFSHTPRWKPLSVNLANEEPRDTKSDKGRGYRQRKGLPFGRCTGRTAPVIGATPTGPDTRPVSHLDKTAAYNHIEKRVVGGKFSKAPTAASKYSSAKSDTRDFTVSQDMQPVMSARFGSSVNMKRASGRKHSFGFGTVAVTSETNREQLNRLLKKVDGHTVPLKPSLAIAAESSSLIRDAKASDFYLCGGRELVFQGLGPDDFLSLQVQEVVADVENQSSRLQRQVYNMNKRLEQDRRRQSSQQKKMNSSELVQYRLSDDYKLKKHCKIYQDEEISKLQDDMNDRTADKVLTGGSFYRISVKQGQQELRREEAAQKAAQRVANALNRDGDIDYDDL